MEVKGVALVSTTRSSGASSWSDITYTTANSGNINHPHDVGDYSENSDINDTYDNGDSCSDRGHSPDIIPFDEQEYQKITTQTRVETDKYHSGVPGKINMESEHPISADCNDEKLEDSLNFDSEKFQENYTSTPVKQTKSDVLHEKTREAKHSEGITQQTEQPVKQVSKDVKTILIKKIQEQEARLESGDIGYSSRSHSNEELDSTNQNYSPSTSPAYQRYPPNTSLKVQANDSVFTNVSSLSASELSWQHSYHNSSVREGTDEMSVIDNSANSSVEIQSVDTYTQDKKSLELSVYGSKSSELSPHVSPGSDDGNDISSYQAIIASPSKKFYQMTTLETDTSEENNPLFNATNTVVSTENRQVMRSKSNVQRNTRTSLVTSSGETLTGNDDVNTNNSATITESAASILQPGDLIIIESSDMSPKCVNKIHSLNTSEQSRDLKIENITVTTSSVCNVKTIDTETQKQRSPIEINMADLHSRIEATSSLVVTGLGVSDYDMQHNEKRHNDTRHDDTTVELDSEVYDADESGNLAEQSRIQIPGCNFCEKLPLDNAELAVLKNLHATTEHSYQAVSETVIATPSGGTIYVELSSRSTSVENELNAATGQEQYETSKITICDSRATSDSRELRVQEKNQLTCIDTFTSIVETQPVTDWVGRRDYSSDVEVSQTRLDYIAQDLDYRLEKHECHKLNIKTFESSGVYGADTNLEILMSEDHDSIKSDSIVANIDSDKSDPEEYENESLNMSVERSDSIQRLVRQAELLIRDEELSHLNTSKWLERKKHKKLKKDRQGEMIKSTSPRDMSADISVNSDNEDYCDASSEYTSESEGETHYNSVIKLVSDSNQPEDNRIETTEAAFHSATKQLIETSSRDTTPDVEIHKRLKQKVRVKSKVTKRTLEAERSTESLELCQEFRITKEGTPSDENTLMSSSAESDQVKGLEQVKVKDVELDVDEWLHTVDGKESEEILSGSDNTDELLGSTVESLSEQAAWDSYQAPPYSSASVDEDEEKLDDSNLQWDDEYHFKGSGMYSTEFFPKSQKSKASKSPPAGGLVEISQIEESDDSDLEDLHHVISESTTQLKVTETSLKKRRKDDMGVGISLNPSKYAEYVANCQTNIKCLADVQSELELDQGVRNLTEDDMHQLEDTIEKWMQLQALAEGKQCQSQDLHIIYKDIIIIKKSLKEIELELTVVLFSGVKDLEEFMMTLQNSKVHLSSFDSRLQKVSDSVQVVSAKYPDLRLTKFSEEIKKLSTQKKVISELSNNRVTELHLQLKSWQEYIEIRQELHYVISRKRQQLLVTELGMEMILSTEWEKKDTIHDLKMMLADIQDYEKKLETFRIQSESICRISTADCKQQVKAEVAVLSNEIFATRERCQLLIKSIKEGKIMREQDTVDCTHRDKKPWLLTHSPKDDGDIILENKEVLVKYKERLRRRKSLCARACCAALPLQLVLIALLLLGLLLVPDCCESWDTYSLEFTPRLRYINGAPPV